MDSTVHMKFRQILEVVFALSTLAWPATVACNLEKKGNAKRQSPLHSAPEGFQPIKHNAAVF